MFTFGKFDNVYLGTLVWSAHPYFIVNSVTRYLSPLNSLIIFYVIALPVLLRTYIHYFEHTQQKYLLILSDFCPLDSLIYF